MSIVNQDKPTTSLTNSDRANIGETWATMITTWATEARTWQRLVSIFTNSDKQSPSITNINKPT